MARPAIAATPSQKKRRESSVLVCCFCRIFLLQKGCRCIKTLQGEWPTIRRRQRLVSVASGTAVLLTGARPDPTAFRHNRLPVAIQKLEAHRLVREHFDVKRAVLFHRRFTQDALPIAAALQRNDANARNRCRKSSLYAFQRIVTVQRN